MLKRRCRSGLALSSGSRAESEPDWHQAQGTLCLASGTDLQDPLFILTVFCTLGRSIRGAQKFSSYISVHAADQ